jgi:hypothetical protein
MINKAIPPGLEIGLPLKPVRCSLAIKLNFILLAKAINSGITKKARKKLDITTTKARLHCKIKQLLNN